MISFVGKSIVLDNEVLVVSDLHLGYGESLRRGGVFVPTSIYKRIANDLETIFDRIGKMKEIVILGDLKHEIGYVLQDERDELRQLFVLLSKHCERIIIVKGNHDALLQHALPVETRLVDYYQYKEYLLLHGDRDFPVLYDKHLSSWIMGHLHPAVTLRDASKEEKYKCFLIGEFKKKKVLIMPSFFPANEGTDPRESSLGLAWPFKLSSFEVKVVEGLETLDFGKLGDLD